MGLTSVYFKDWISADISFTSPKEKCKEYCQEDDSKYYRMHDVRNILASQGCHLRV